MPVVLLVVSGAMMTLLAGPAEAKTVHLGERTLRTGSKGHDVRELQTLLTRAGTRTKTDGVFGAGTVRAVRSFEQGQRRKVDGVVSRRDVVVLRDVATNGGAVSATGGAKAMDEATDSPEPTPLKLTAGPKATIGPDGLAVAPAGAPPAVQQVIAAGNKIATKPYIYGGGHGKWEDAGYDCSGSVSYALHGAGLLDQSLASGGFMTWAESGPGQWITVYANQGHMYMMVAGLRFDTSGRASAGTRWQTEKRGTSGYAVRHPAGL